MLPNLHPIDLLVIFAYLFTTVGIVWWARKHQNDTEDYFLAGRSMPKVIVGISLFATLFSTGSFVSVPGEAYKNGSLLFLRSPAYLLGLPLAIWLFLRFFYQQKTFTAYEYLERRFNANVRKVGSFVFLIARCFYASTVLYAASKIFISFLDLPTDWAISPEAMVILGVGAFSIIYTTIGGMRAVMITDVFQTAILLLGLFGVGFTVLHRFDFDVAGVYHFAQQREHGFGKVATAEFYSFDPHVRFTLWILVLYFLSYPLISVGTDQLTVQRLLSGKGYKEAKSALWIKAWMGMAVIGVLYFLGLALFQFYHSGAAELPNGIESDRVLGYFIATELSPPFPGLLIAALLAALMSTIDSTINSLSAVTNIDFLGKWKGMPQTPKGKMIFAKLLTLAWGVVILTLACLISFATAKDDSTSVLEITVVWETLWLVLLAVFLLGVLTRWATPLGVGCGGVLGAATSLTIPWFFYFPIEPEDRISFAWLGVPGFLVTLLVCVTISLLWPKRD